MPPSADMIIQDFQGNGWQIRDKTAATTQATRSARRRMLGATEEGLNADVFGPMAFDNSVSEKAAQIKGIKNAVAGKTDILLVPNVETGNALVKMMIFFMGACAAGVVVGGKVPVVITRCLSVSWCAG